MTQLILVSLDMIMIARTDMACYPGASKKRFALLLVWRTDRAFRSVLDAAATLERLQTWGVGLRSYSEPWLDTTSPSEKPSTTSPWLMPNWNGESSGRESRQEWTGPADRSIG